MGWYHSHPGYGCWLTNTVAFIQEMIYQRFHEPIVAIVIDPTRTAFTGKVVIGAFRTYYNDEKLSDEGPTSGYQTIPRDKIQDFLRHRKEVIIISLFLFF